jgi:hypothetical protein
MLTFIPNPMKILLLIVPAFIFSVAATYAQIPQDPNHRSIAKPYQEKLKVNLYLAVNYMGIGDGLLVEYKLTEKIGLQSGAVVSIQAYPITRTTNETNLLLYEYIPLTLRYYVGEAKQFCWFGGIRGYHFSGGLTKRKSTDNKYLMSINVGFDYETKLGFIGGINLYEHELTYITKKPFELNYPQSLAFTVGYNFVRLFHILQKLGN